jgi:branched-chain amino acid transport system substrate-binding protein
MNLRTMITYFVTVPVVASAALASFPAYTLPSLPTDEIRIGVMAPLTGDYASAGEEIQRGISLASEQLASEGIKVKVTFENACLPAQGVAALRKMVDNDSIDAVASNYCVITLNAIQPLLERLNLITFQNSSVAEQLVQTSPYIYTTWPSIEAEVAAIAQAIGDSAIQRPALIYLESPWGEGYAQAFRNLLSQRGIKLNVDLSQGFDVHDFRSEVTKIQAAKSSSALIAHTGSVMASFLKQAVAMNIPGNSLFVPSDNDDQAIVNAAGRAAEGVSLFSTEGPSDTPGRALFRAAYEKRFNRAPDPLSRHAHDELIIVVRALHACKKDVTCTRSHIAGVKDFDGASGSFSMNSRRIPERALYRKQVKDGAFRLVDSTRR